MKNTNGFEKRSSGLLTDKQPTGHYLHPAWLAFVRYCQELQHGEIERLKIQDGLPVIAEVVKKKIKFTS